MIEPFVDVEWVRGHREEVVLADCRWYLDGRSGRDAYDGGHLPGAVFVDLDTALTRHADPAEAGRHPLAEPEDFAAAMGALGIGDEDTVIAYDDAGGVIAARLVWMLRVTGHAAALLDGGLAAWGEGLETPPASRPAAAFTASEWPADRLATIDEVAAASRRSAAPRPEHDATAGPHGDRATHAGPSAAGAEPDGVAHGDLATPADPCAAAAEPVEPDEAPHGDHTAPAAPPPAAGAEPDGVTHRAHAATAAPSRSGAEPDEALVAPGDAPAPLLVDARQRERYLGEPDGVDPRAGHIPGALSVPCRENLDGEGRLLPPDLLRANFPFADGADVISYCGSGVTACHNLLAMEQAGLGRGRLFPGSWSQWSRDPARAAETAAAGAP